MTEISADAQLKLASWFSAAYPVGAFAYSHGLEWAIEAGSVRSPEDLAAWSADCVAHGAGWSDAVLLSAAYRASDPAEIAELAALAAALQPSAERRRESLAQGRAFAETTAAAWGGDLPEAALPIVIGRAAALHQLPLEAAVLGHLHGFAAMLIAAGVRLIPIGQTAGQSVQARLSPLIRDTAAAAARADLGAIGGCAIAADIASMRHETQTVRLFQS